MASGALAEREVTASRFLQERLLIDIEELAQLIRVSSKTIRRRVHMGDFLRPVRLGNSGPIRFRAKEVEAWISAGCPSREKWEALGADAWK